MLLALQGCLETLPSDHCAGWKFIDMQDASVTWLAANDPPALRKITGHDQFYTASNCP